MKLTNIPIGRRLGIGFAIVIVIFLCVGWAALATANKLKDADDLNTHTYKVLTKAATLLTAMVNMETGARGFLVAGEDKFLAPLTAGVAEFKHNWNELKQLTSDNPTQQKRLDEMMTRHLEFKAVADSMILMRRAVSAGSKTLPELVTEFGLGRDKTAMDAFRQLEADFEKMERDLLVERTASANAVRALNRNAIIGGTLFAMLAAIILGVINTRAITVPMQQALELAKAVADGDLSTEIGITANDETGKLLAALKVMQANLAQVVGGVRESAEGVASTSTQIAQGNADLSQRTEDQAASLEETAASMEELGTTVRQNADNAQQANQLAQGASSVAAKGGEVVSQVVQTMKGINDSSRRIADILGVIDGIAFQTNILALNAAVEAARAGEQGRGFAVVATEVRNLAQRSAEAAKQIKGLINASVDQVEQGSTLVDQAGATMGEIVTAIQKVSDIMSEISTASAEQSIGVRQVGESITNMDTATQQNAALVEESSASAAALKVQAQKLVEAVAVFKLKNMVPTRQLQLR